MRKLLPASYTPCRAQPLLKWFYQAKSNETALTQEKKSQATGFYGNEIHYISQHKKYSKDFVNEPVFTGFLNIGFL